MTGQNERCCDYRTALSLRGGEATVGIRIPNFSLAEYSLYFLKPSFFLEIFVVVL